METDKERKQDTTASIDRETRQMIDKICSARHWTVKTAIAQAIRLYLAMNSDIQSEQERL